MQKKTYVKNTAISQTETIFLFLHKSFILSFKGFGVVQCNFKSKVFTFVIIFVS